MSVRHYCQLIDLFLVDFWQSRSSNWPWGLKNRRPLIFHLARFSFAQIFAADMRGKKGKLAVKTDEKLEDNIRACHTDTITCLIQRVEVGEPVYKKVLSWSKPVSMYKPGCCFMRYSIRSFGPEIKICPLTIVILHAACDNVVLESQISVHYSFWGKKICTKSTAFGHIDVSGLFDGDKIKFWAPL